MDDKQSLWQPNPQTRIAVLGAGYVGLPVALAFADQYPTVVCDIDTSKIARLQRGEDPSGEIEAERLKRSALTYCADHREIADASVYIVTVPTPVDAFNYPDLTALKQVSCNLAELLKPGDLVIYESTVFPGATEEVCVPILEDGSKLRCHQDFAVGYSPERINPGDTVHTLERIVKVTSGSCAKSAEFVDQLYRGIITAGTHKAPSIKVAEAAKAIENTQRDVNIALMNELAGMFDALDISTADVLDAAASKWNFLRFSPGLVGGHCIGVDPYYLIHIAQQAGYHPELIMASRRINNQMVDHVLNRLLALFARKHVHIVGAKILLLGITFKENCSDIRNSQVVRLAHALQKMNAEIILVDPHVDANTCLQSAGIQPLREIPEKQRFDAAVLAVAHEQFNSLTGEQIRKLVPEPGVVFDVKNQLPRSVVDGAL